MADQDEDAGSEGGPAAGPGTALAVIAGVLAVLALLTYRVRFMRSCLWNESGYMFLGIWAVAALGPILAGAKGAAALAMSLFGVGLGTALLLPLAVSLLAGVPLQAPPQPLLAGYALLVAVLLALLAGASKDDDDGGDEDEDEDEEAVQAQHERAQAQGGAHATWLLAVVGVTASVMVTGRTMLRRFSVPDPQAGTFKRLVLMLLAGAPLFVGYTWGRISSFSRRWVLHPLFALLRASVRGEAKNLTALQQARSKVAAQQGGGGGAGGDDALARALATLTGDEMAALQVDMLQRGGSGDGAAAPPMSDFDTKVHGCVQGKLDSVTDTGSELPDVDKLYEACHRSMRRREGVAYVLKLLLMPLYVLTPKGIAMMLRTLLAHTQASWISERVAKMLAPEAREEGEDEEDDEGKREPAAKVALRALAVLLASAGAIMAGGIAMAVAVTVVAALVLAVAGFPSWRDQPGGTLLSVAQIVAFRLLRVFDLRGFSGVGTAEAVLDDFASSVYKVWRAFHNADDACLDVARAARRWDRDLEETRARLDEAATELAASVQARAQAAAVEKVGALLVFRRDAEKVLENIAALRLLCSRGYVRESEVNSMEECLARAHDAVAADRPQDLQAIVRTFTGVLLQPNLRLMRAHRIGYMLALAIISLAASLGAAAAQGARPRNPDERARFTREHVAAALVVSFVLIVAVNAYIVMM